jgi:hypothetical protein
MNVLSTLKVMPETKAEIRTFAESLISSIQFGEVDPLEVDGRLKAMEELIGMVRKSQEMQECILHEAYLHGKKSFELGNFKYQIKEVGVKYDFTGCNDIELEDLVNEKKEIDEKIKDKQKFLKGLNENSEVYSSEGVKLNPPVKTSTTKVISLLK